MKQPPFTLPPLMGQKAEKLSLRQLLLGHAAGEAYYEAHREDNGVYLLWMEFSRFGRTFAYPCALQERDHDAYVFRAGNSDGNYALLDRWKELVDPEHFEEYQVSALKKDKFQSIYNAFQRGE